MEKEIVKFDQWECHIQLAYYTNKRLAINLVSAVENLDDMLFLGEPIATATANLPDVHLLSNEVIIKNYSENEGMLETLKKAGYISESIKEVSSGFVKLNVVQKTAKLQKLEQEYQDSLEHEDPKKSSKMKR